MTAVVLRGDAASLPLPDGSVDLIVTSPPYYGLRSYTDGGEHYAGQIGSEATPAEYVAALIRCTREWVRVLKPSGSLFVNLGDKYSSGGRTSYDRTDMNGARGSVARPLDGAPEKCLLGLPWRYALAATDQLGLILRAEIIWAKPNGLPESVTDRVRRSHEQWFHLVRQPRYYAAVDEIREPHAPTSLTRYGNRLGQQKYSRENGFSYAADAVDPNPLGKLPGSVWTIPSQPLTVPPELGVDHFAAFPMELPRRIILGWSPPGICTACGEGRRPVSVRSTVFARDQAHASEIAARAVARSTTTGGTAHSTLSGQTTRTITGWVCDCHPDKHSPMAAPTRPAVVLDPFGGTGTTALLAHTLGRVGISVDRSGDYSRLARWRTTDPGERARALEVDKPPAVIDGQGELFAIGS